MELDQAILKKYRKSLLSNWASATKISLRTPHL